MYFMIQPIELKIKLTKNKHKLFWLFSEKKKYRQKYKQNTQCAKLINKNDENNFTKNTRFWIIWIVLERILCSDSNGHTRPYKTDRFACEMHWVSLMNENNIYTSIVTGSSRYCSCYFLSGFSWRGVCLIFSFGLHYSFEMNSYRTSYPSTKVGKKRVNRPEWEPNHTSIEIKMYVFHIFWANQRSAFIYINE